MRLVVKASACLLAAGFALGAFGISVAQADELPPKLKELVAAANKEGEINVTWSANTLGGPQGAKLFEERMAKLYGSTVKIKWAPGRSMPEVGNEIAMRYTNGLPSPTDVYYGFSRNMADLLKYKLFVNAPWQDYAPGRITTEIAEYDNTFVKVQTAYTGFAVSNKHAPFIPTSLSDLLKPEWKGKIATTSYGAGFEMLSSKDLWGAEKTIEWAKLFSAQVSGLLRCSDTDRLLSGEFAALVTDCGGTSTMEAIADGAPLTHVIPPELNIVSFFYLAVPKNSAHPNAAKMLIVYLLSEEGQTHIGSMRGGMDVHLLPGSKTGDRIHKLEGEWNKKFVNADIAWQLGNEEGNKAQRIVKDIITRNK
jgi:ABC-type Fe3+ transport system substrate-binding protein